MASSWTLALAQSCFRQATSARTIAELRAEQLTPERLGRLAVELHE